MKTCTSTYILSWKIIGPEDELVTQSYESAMVIHWLYTIHLLLPRATTNKLIKVLKENTIASIWDEISPAIPAVMKDLDESQEAWAMRARYQPSQKGKYN